MVKTANIQATITPATALQDIDASPPIDEGVFSKEGDYLDKELERSIRNEHLITLQTNNKERVKYAKNTFKLTCWWVSIVIGIVLFNGFKITNLSDAVLITLISTTTINVFGFFLLVMKYLFNVYSPSKDIE